MKTHFYSTEIILILQSIHHRLYNYYTFWFGLGGSTPEIKEKKVRHFYRKKLFKNCSKNCSKIV